MSVTYDIYLDEHVDNVKKGLRWMLDNLDLSQEEKDAAETALTSTHDNSKYESEEYDQYDKYFYGGNRSHQVVQDFNYAWLHHIHNNPHHWQYWVLLEDDPETGVPVKALQIPLNYIFEMVADWWTFSWKSGNLFEIFDWYQKHRNIQHMHARSRKEVESILDRMEKKLKELESLKSNDTETQDVGPKIVKHYGIEGQQWGKRRFQYTDGSLTPEGRKRYLKDSRMDPTKKKDDKKSDPLFDISKLGKGTYTPPGAPGPDGKVGRATGTEEPDYYDWEKSLYEDLMKSGKDVANMSDEQFKAMLVAKGVLKEDAAASLVATMKQRAMKNYKIFSKKDEPATTETATATTDTDKKTSKSKKSSGESSGKSSSGKASGGSGESAGSGREAAEPKNTMPKMITREKPSVDSLEKDISSRIDKLSKLKKGSIELEDILDENMDGFISKITSLIDIDISGLTYAELKELRERLMKTFEDSKKDKEKEKESDNDDSESKEDEDDEKVKHSDVEDSDEGLYGIPEIKKYPMPDKKHVKSAIRFFNYVDPKYEEELAKAILEKAKEFGLNLEEDITVGDENRFKKYLEKTEK